MSKRAAKPTLNSKLTVNSAGCIGCFVLFALPFAVMGALLISAILYQLWLWQSAQRWVETPAVVLESSLDKQVDSEGDATYAVEARYKYTFNGLEYESDRVGLQEGHDNFGTIHQDMAVELEAIRKAGRATVCYVNPRRPSSALLFRDLRLGPLALNAMVGGLFSLIGFGMLGGGYYGRRRYKQEELAKKAAPNKPWLWRPDWAEGRIRSSDSAMRWFLTIFAIIWNAICWPIGLNVLTQGQQVGEPSKWLIAFFPLAGAGVALGAIYMWLRRVRWGVSDFEMAAVPGVLGGPLAGMIRVPRGIRAEQGFVLRLACQRTTQSGDSSNTETVWEREKTIVRTLVSNDGGRTLIPVKFLVPYDEPPSDENVKWKLSVTADVVGVDYHAEFDVPVFRTSASSKNLPDEIEAEEEGAVEEESIAATVARMNAVLADDTGHSRTIRFPPARNRSVAAFLVLFAAVGTAICYGLYMSGAPRIIPGVSAFFDLLLIYATIRVCFGSTILEYNSGGVAYSHRTFGIGRRHDVPRADITAIEVDKSGTTYGDRAFRKVVLTTADGRRTIASEIPRMEDAERLAADIRRVVGLDDGESSSAPSPLEGELPSDFLGTDKD